MSTQADKDSFFQKVYEVARLVPKGRVTSYGAIGRFLGMTSSARMVGWAMNSCGSQTEPVPAHRVVNRNGLLTGKHHFPQEDMMQELLESEGVVVVEDKVKDFNKIFWDPNVELDLER